jgi:hypothetical protein
MESLPGFPGKILRTSQHGGKRVKQKVALGAARGIAPNAKRRAKE